MELREQDGLKKITDESRTYRFTEKKKKTKTRF